MTMACSVGLSAVSVGEEPIVTEKVQSTIPLETVWTGHRVGFCLLTAPPIQYAAYYDADRQMTVAQRQLDQTEWQTTKLPSHVVWDSHNYVTMALDSEGHLHVSGNMHVNPLIYFRTTRAGDASSLAQIETMVSPDVEKRMTYPRFFRGADAALVFRYRDGASGHGNDHYNVYNAKTRSWHALIDGPLTDGKGKMNGYFAAPAQGPDGLFHMVGVWRDTPDAATNHHPSYARSRDLIHWEKADGTPLPLPLTLGNIDVVEDLPPRQGLINGNCRLGFDAAKRPVVTYHRYDADGNSQIYAACPEDGQWQITQVSDWEGYRWDFGGGGSIPFDVRLGGVKLREDDVLTLRFSRKEESGTWALDPETLKPTGLAPPSRVRRARMGKPKPSFPGMQVRLAGDAGTAEDDNIRYVLRWETLGQNRDRPRKGPLPEPVMLELLRLVTPAE